MVVFFYQFLSRFKVPRRVILVSLLKVSFLKLVSGCQQQWRSMELKILTDSNTIRDSLTNTTLSPWNQRFQARRVANLESIVCCTSGVEAKSVPGSLPSAALRLDLEQQLLVIVDLLFRLSCDVWAVSFVVVCFFGFDAFLFPYVGCLFTMSAASRHIPLV